MGGWDKVNIRPYMKPFPDTQAMTICHIYIIADLQFQICLFVKYSSPNYIFLIDCATVIAIIILSGPDWIEDELLSILKFRRLRSPDYI